MNDPKNPSPETIRKAIADIAEQLKEAAAALERAKAISEETGVQFYYEGPVDGAGGSYIPKSAWQSSDSSCEWKESGEEGIDWGWVSSSAHC